jgi:hypothetical protein
LAPTGCFDFNIIDKQRGAVVATLEALGYTFSLAAGRSSRPSLPRIRRASETVDWMWLRKLHRPDRGQSGTPRWPRPPAPFLLPPSQGECDRREALRRRWLAPANSTARARNSACIATAALPTLCRICFDPHGFHIVCGFSGRPMKARKGRCGVHRQPFVPAGSPYGRLRRAGCQYYAAQFRRPAAERGDIVPDCWDDTTSLRLLA